jgi:hypothetical protein
MAAVDKNDYEFSNIIYSSQWSAIESISQQEGGGKIR